MEIILLALLLALLYRKDDKPDFEQTERDDREIEHIAKRWNSISES